MKVHLVSQEGGCFISSCFRVFTRFHFIFRMINARKISQAIQEMLHTAISTLQSALRGIRHLHGKAQPVKATKLYNGSKPLHSLHKTKNFCNCFF